MVAFKSVYSVLNEGKVVLKNMESSLLRLGQISAFSLLLLVVALPVSSQELQNLTLEYAIDLAIEGDDWLIVSQQEENALLEQAIASGELPDPKMMVGLPNMPLDTLNFNQEPMTQFRVGVSQSFPRGDSLKLQRRRVLQQSEVNPFQRDDRKAAVSLEVSRLWLDGYLAEQSITLINNDRVLFEQLVDITNARYTSAAGLARQQDLVRAEVELVRLDDRLAMLRQLQDRSKQRLAEWLPYEYLSLPLSPELQQRPPPSTELSGLAQASEYFLNHPKVRAQDKKIEIAQTQIEITEQSFKPSYSVGVNYGYRGNAPGGIERADFISLDVSFDLPLFTEKRQKPRLRASQYRASARQTERMLLIKDLFANYQQAMAQLVVLDERRALFNDTLLSQLSDLTQATLSSYTADEGDFEEVMRAYIAELNAKIELLQIEVERSKIISQLDYLLTTSAL
ncbi:MAG: TolC family protein [Gammaproteobacteria bacterium]